MKPTNGNPMEALIAAGAAAQFTSTREEYDAARSHCAVFPGEHRALAAASGEDRVSFLHGMLTSDVRSLAPGHGQPSAFLTDSGKVVADLRLYCEDAGFLLDCLTWCRDPLLARLDKYLVADDVEFGDGDGRAVIACLEGPRVGAVAAAVFGSDPHLPPFASREVQFAGATLRAWAVSDIGGAGLALIGPAALRDELVAACRAAGALPAGLRALDVLRLEAGIPWAGVDMGEDTLLMEIGLAETISRTKGCYLGQEVIERVSARGQVNRNLCALAIDADPGRLPAAMELHTAAGSSVGRISSWVWSPALGGVLAIGLLHRKGRGGEELRAIAPEGEFACRLVDFPAAGGR